jgi:serine/threonine protein kinase
MIMEIQAGDVLRGRYEIQELLRAAPDKGVYLAHDRVLDRPVVVDVFSHNSVMPNGLTVSAWEARVLGKLDDHPNIATAQDYWEEGETAVMVSRYLSGGTLQDRIASSRESSKGLPVEDILRIATEIARGLEHIHGRRVLYRDLQPRNVLFDEWGTVHLVDFDTAVWLDDREMSDLSRGRVIEHMAPELTDGESADERADLYSLGATIYEMCQGHPPFTGTRTEIVVARRTSPPPPLLRDDLSGALKDLVFCLLAPECDQRPASAAEVVKHLEELRADWAARESHAPTPRDSHSLPRPDAAELRASVGVKAADYAIGDVIDDRFEIVETLGEGGFSKVYRVRDDVEDEERALKLFDNARGYEAVRREIGALRKIRHPNVVEVYWAGRTRGGEWYLITEFITGEPLSEFTGGKRVLRDREAVDVALDLLDALVAFHPDSERLNQLDAKGREEGELSEAEFNEWRELTDKGLVHRDIKPFNVMLTRTGAKLLDFNIASRVGDEVKTQSGTPPYQPPDANFTRWDVSPDLFAVGVVLYQLLCDGQHPYPNSQPMVDEPVIDPRTIRPDLDPGLAEFAIKACSSANADRFPTAVEMRHALREIRADL